MTSPKLFALSTSLALFLGAASAQAETWNAFDDFSIATNPNGAWSYGEGTAGSTFTPFVNKVTTSQVIYWQTTNPSLGAPAVIKNTTGSSFAYPTVVFPNDVLDIHPGPNSDVIVQFTAPTAGTYSYSGLFEVLDYVQSNGVIGLIYKNGTQLFSQEFGGTTANATTLTAGSMITFMGSVLLAAGDKLSFAVNNDGNYLYDSTGFQVVISDVSPVPLPGALPLMAAGLGSLALLRRRKRKAA
ncbi:VPLPA-CTERM sorting domain-containing protein [Aestuariivirga sp.]|uniref:VPLPA-CTERM sorting domain-containing protein n=1 Tax=Aestuariivirga sp. TaxID=2650926 RepID=UPI0039E404C6